MTIEKPLHLTLIAGARPNFMKIASLVHAIKQKQQAGCAIAYTLVHTGQHYDSKLSDVFFEDLQIPLPDVNLEVGSGSHARQTAEIMIRFEDFIRANPTDWVIVVGDVNSTLACTIVAKKLGIPVAHVEAGIRSGDQSMPEEINRLVTDSIADLFFTTSIYANQHLLREGKNERQVHLVGNTMIDSLVRNRERFTAPAVFDKKNLTAGDYYLMTLHRPSNVDDAAVLQSLLEQIIQAIGNMPLVFPVHPRTRKKLEELDFQWPPSILLCDPLRYLEFLYLVQHARAVITDSGGIQEETTYLGVPCLTLRANTERPETIHQGTNLLIGDDMGLLNRSLAQIEQRAWKKGSIPDYWDGKAGERIVERLVQLNIAE
jgi:UDP-N-acetylglucosamine 2-epimerase (non-hydrolysing)